MTNIKKIQVNGVEYEVYDEAAHKLINATGGGSPEKDYVNKTHYGYSGNDLLIIPEGTTEIAANKYQNTTYKCIVVPDSVISIGSRAFQSCSDLKSIIIPYGVRSIGDRAFVECRRLNQITIPASVTSIENLLFYNCDNLTSITIPNSVTSIGNGAFNNCSNLTSIIIPNSVTIIKDQAFVSCTNLKNVTLSNQITDINDRTFGNCIRLESIIIPSSIKHIREYAFTECYAFKQIDLTQFGLSKSFPSLGADAFRNTSRNLQILVPKGRKAELAAMTNWSAFVSKIVEVPTLESLQAEIDALKA